MQTWKLFKIIYALPAKIRRWWFIRKTDLNETISDLTILMGMYPEIFVMEHLEGVILIKASDKHPSADQAVIRLQEKTLTLDLNGFAAIPLNESQTIMLIMAVREWLRGFGK